MRTHGHNIVYSIVRNDVFLHAERVGDQGRREDACGSVWVYFVPSLVVFTISILKLLPKFGLNQRPREVMKVCCKFAKLKTIDWFLCLHFSSLAIAIAT